MIKLLVASVLLFGIFRPPGWITNMNDAKQIARKEDKLILLNFSGSDWCIPCIKLHKEVFESEAFSTYAANHLILINADFPRQKKNKISKEQEISNDLLAEKYNPQGNFPFTVLLNAEGSVIKVWDGFYKNGAESFVKELDNVQSAMKTH